MKSINLIVAIGFLVSTSAVLNAQTSASASAVAHAQIMRPIHLTWENPLEFGTLIPPSTGTGYATMDVTGMGANSVTGHGVCPLTPTMSGGAGRTDLGPNTPSACTFLVEGEPGLLFGVELPPLQVVVVPMHRIGPGTPTLALDNFQTNLTGSDPAFGAGSGTGHGGTATLTGGYKYFAVGARLTLPAGTPPGEYSGQFNVRVFYN